MEETIKNENDCSQMTEANVVEGIIEKITCQQLIKAKRLMESGKKIGSFIQ